MTVDKVRKRLIFCSERNCEAEVTYSISDRQLSTNYEVIVCPEMSGGEAGCNRSCMALFGFIEAIRSSSS